MDKSHFKATSWIKQLKKDQKETCDNPNFEYNENMRAKETYLVSKIEHLVTTNENWKQEELRALITNHGEKLGGIWSAINKEKKPRDLI